jgi:hypothetical protein
MFVRVNCTVLALLFFEMGIMYSGWHWLELGFLLVLASILITLMKYVEE